MSGHAMANMLKYAKVHRDLKPLNLLLTKYLEVHRHAMHTMRDVQEIAGASNSSYLFMLYVPCGHIGHSRYSMIFHMRSHQYEMVRAMALCLHYVCTMSMTVCDSLRLFVWGQSCRLGHCSSLGSGSARRARVRLRAERDDRWHRHLALHGSGSGATPEVHWEGIWHHLTPMNILAWKLLSFSDVSIVSPSVSWNILHHKFLWIRWDGFAKSRWGRCCLTVLDVKSCPFMPTLYDMLWLADTHRS